MTVKRRMNTADKLTVKCQSKNKGASPTGGDLFSKRHRDLDLERSRNSQKMSNMKTKYNTNFSNKMMMILVTIMLLAFQSVSSAHSLNLKLTNIAQRRVLFEAPVEWMTKDIGRWDISVKKLWQANIRKLKNKKGLEVDLGGMINKKLDAAFITKNILAVQGPGTGKCRARNDVNLVRKLLVKTLLEVGGSKAMIVNTRTERPFYNSTKNVDFENQKKDEEITFPRKKFPIKRFAFDDHKAPLMEDFDRWLDELSKFMGGDNKNVLAVHCNAGKARTGTMIVALMLRHILHPDNDGFLSALLSCTEQLSKKKEGKKSKKKHVPSPQSLESEVSKFRRWRANIDRKTEKSQGCSGHVDGNAKYVGRMLSLGQSDQYLNFLVSQVLLYYADKRTRNLCAVRRSTQRRYVWWSLKWFLMDEEKRNSRRIATYEIESVIVDKRFSKKVNIDKVQVFKKGFTQAYDELVAASIRTMHTTHTFEDLTEDERVTGDSKSMKGEKGDVNIPVRNILSPKCIFHSTKSAKVKGDFMIRIGNGRMDFHYNTIFLDPSRNTHKITLSSSQLNGEKSMGACVGAYPELRAQNLRVEINFKKVETNNNAVVLAWLDQLSLMKATGLIGSDLDAWANTMYKRLGRVPNCVSRRRLTERTRPGSKQRRYHSRRRLGQRESLMERMARLEDNGGR